MTNNKVKSFFERQPQKIQDIVARMTREHTAREIVIELKKHGVEANENNIFYYRLINNVQTVRYEVNEPEETFESRIKQYIDTIPEFKGRMWSNRNLGFRGQLWSPVTVKLCKAGLIKVVAKRPNRYEMTVSHEKIVEWYNKEINI